jgi:hypothetical protein
MHVDRVSHLANLANVLPLGKVAHATVTTQTSTPRLGMAWYYKPKSHVLPPGKPS